ncbi:MAG: FtsW/RodA/SpoVE family cell cycle protein [Turicibacter sp.]|nr:FtsW/RodA/SpoVE family cell cycle protein [Turicibacter sp.]
MKERLSKFSAIFYTPILIYFVLFVAISLVAIASATPLAWIQYQEERNYMIRQAVFFVIGGVAMISVLFFGMKRLRFIRWSLYGIFLIMLLLILAWNRLPGFQPAWIVNINGATRWIDLEFMQIQPSEFMRISLILVLADIIQKHNEKTPHEQRTFKTDFWLILKALLVVLVPAGLIFEQPDSGITILILITLSFMLLASGIKWTYIVVVATIGIAFTYTFLTLAQYYPDMLLESGLIEPYQLQRFLGWFDPFGSISGYGRHLAFGLIGMGSGGIFGNGFQSTAAFFPEAHTDYIFAVIGMDFGMIASMFVIIICLLFNFTILNTAVLNRGHYNSHVCVGIFTSLMAQQFWNIGMTLGIIPISGVTLPFISHGGSSVLASMIMLGIVLSSHVEGKELSHSETTFREDILFLPESS